MASDAGFNEMDFDAWPDMDSGEGMYPDLDFIDATTLDTDPSVLADEWQEDPGEESDYDEETSLYSTFNAPAWFDDKELVQGHSMAAELRHGEKFNQKIPPTYDGQMSFFLMRN